MPHTILVVDDNASHRRMLVDGLGSLGFQTVGVEGVKEAIQHLGTGELVDLVLTDIYMPGIPGDRLIEALCRHRSTRDLPVVAISADHTDRTQVAALRAGAVDFIPKTARLPVVAVKIRNLLRIARRRAATLPAAAPPRGRPDSALLALPALVARARDVLGGPGLLPKLLELKAGAEITLAGVMRLLEQSPALAARVLRLANSRFYRGEKEVVDLTRAAIRLGWPTVLNIAAAVESVEALSRLTAGSTATQALTRHVLAAAVIARGLARRLFRLDPALAYLGALLREIGTPLVFQVWPEWEQRLAQRIRATGQRSEEIEREELGFRHADLNAALLRDWRLPESVIDTIASSVPGGPVPADPAFTRCLILAERFAVLLGHTIEWKDFIRPGAGGDEIDHFAAQFAGQPRADLVRLAGEVAAEVDEAFATFFPARVAPTLTPSSGAERAVAVLCADPSAWTELLFAVEVRGFTPRFIDLADMPRLREQRPRLLLIAGAPEEGRDLADLFDLLDADEGLQTIPVLAVGVDLPAHGAGAAADRPAPIHHLPAPVELSTMVELLE
ncbi:MAG: HDOD domain-containing protein, partial [Planctomycetes bacterium]|nr:HDOD domain-containing protein [Planctomycetota bacterium]